MKEKRRSFLSVILPAFVFITILSIITYNYYLLTSGSSYFNNEAMNIAQRYASQTVSSIQSETGDSFSSISTVAAQIPSVSGFEKIDDFGEKTVEQYKFTCLQFLKDGEAQYRYGDSVGSASASEVRELVASGVFGTSPVYNDKSLGVPCVAVYCPVSGSTEIDGVLTYCRVDNLFSGKDNLNEFTKYYCVADCEGNIIESYSAQGMKSDVSHDIFTYLGNITENSDEISHLREQIENRIGGVYNVSIDTEKYIVSTAPISRLGSDCFIIQIFSVSEILHSQYTLYDRMLVSFIILSIIVIVSILICVLEKRRGNQRLVIELQTDALLGCSTYNKFIYDATEILEHNRYSKYAIIYFHINKFQFIKQNFGSDGADATLKFVSNVIKRMIDENETYGHTFDEYFVVLMHYSNQNELGERIKLLGSLISKFDLFLNNEMEAMISVGIYIVQPDKRLTTQEMVDFAHMALNANKRLNEELYVIYTPAIASSYIDEAAIEAKMKVSLKNKDFKLFFQPKYGIKTDKVSSAEVLVRWYDTENQSYIAPDSFIHVFEANGFVADLDKYVFEEVCRFLQEYTLSGEKLVPLSVNVSRATAIRDDFLQFYIEKKKQYKIADDFITLEFTESFANESYELLEQMLITLKNNGFRCSIDDFGMGHSSLIALKELPFNELKLDRALLKVGTNVDKDNAVLKTLIDMGKSLGMEITQEGVETIEDMKRMADLNCDLIQGYFYSKPMPLIDFVEFINDDTSLNGIIRFKKGEGIRKEMATAK